MDKKELIPNDWRRTKLGEVTFESSIRQKDTTYEDLPVYGVDNVVGLNPNPRYTADSFDRYKLVEHGMFAYNPMRLNIGSIGYCSDKHPICLVSPDYVVFGCQKDYLLPDFLYHVTFSQQWIDQTKNAGSGSVRFRIYYGNLGGFSLVLPPLHEQRKIAEILSTWDEAIALTEQLIAALSQRKQALMQLLLTGTVRFPGFEGEWEEDVLGNVSNFLDGQRKPIKESERERVHGTYPYYGASGIIDFVDDYIFDDDLILLGEDGENILSRNLPLAFRISGKTWVNNHAHVIKPKDFMDISFLTTYLESLDYTPYNSGTAQPKLNKKVCLGIKVVVPSTDEQRKIGDVINACEDQVKFLLLFGDQLQTQKRGLMQQLLTGAVRVSTEE